jgi:hypothetical protein
VDAARGTNVRTAHYPRDAAPQPIPLAVASLLSDLAHLRGASPIRRNKTTGKAGF